VKRQLDDGTPTGGQCSGRPPGDRFLSIRTWLVTATEWPAATWVPRLPCALVGLTFRGNDIRDVELAKLGISVMARAAEQAD